tara:strand:- start:462 stop:581 length:120 start_codon:yes stop_codon:yes gene_type:complete
LDVNHLIQEEGIFVSLQHAFHPFEWFRVKRLVVVDIRLT